MARTGKAKHNLQWVTFAEALAETNDYAEASLVAGYNCQDRKAHYKNGQRVAKNPKVIPLIESARKKRFSALGATKEGTFTRIYELAHFDLGRFMRVGEDGIPYWDFSGATRSELSLIAELNIDFYVEGRGESAQQIKKVKIKGHDQAKYIDMWNKINGHYEADNEQGAGAIMNLLQKGRERVKSGEA